VSYVRLRSVVDKDSEILFKWINDRELVEFNSAFRPISRREHDAWFESIRSKNDVVFFMIEDIGTGITIGSCQLLNISRVKQTAELQIRIGDRRFHNKGAGTDAVRKLSNYGFLVLNLKKISLHVFSFNGRAIRVYEKNGYLREDLKLESVHIDGRAIEVVRMVREAV
jgi:RimJ/RimL family protein N-acetyltransferase